MTIFYGYYSAGQAAMCGTAVYELLDGDVTPEARTVFDLVVAWPPPCGATRAVHVTEVSDRDRQDMGNQWSDLVRVGRVGRCLRPRPIDRAEEQRGIVGR